MGLGVYGVWGRISVWPPIKLSPKSLLPSSPLPSPSLPPQFEGVDFVGPDGQWGKLSIVVLGTEPPKACFVPEGTPFSCVPDGIASHPAAPGSPTIGTIHDLESLMDYNLTDEIVATRNLREAFRAFGMSKRTVYLPRQETRNYRVPDGTHTETYVETWEEDIDGCGYTETRERTVTKTVQDLKLSLFDCSNFLKFRILFGLLHVTA